MNDPASFVSGSEKGCTDNSLDHPPYKPSKYIKSLTRYNKPSKMN